MANRRPHSHVAISLSNKGVQARAMRIALTSLAAVLVLSASASAQMPPTPTRLAVMNAMQNVESGIDICARQFGAGHGTFQAVIVFDHSGAVESVEVGAPVGETPFGNCVRRAIGLARVPAFVDATFRISYPFRH